MRKSLLVLFSLFIQLSFTYAASNPKREFRAVWFTTHYCIDWPSSSTPATSATNIAKQKKQLCAYLDTLKAGNLHAIMLQVRPTADAFYQSSYEPWSHNLTGTRGRNPGYDPLQFAIEECHKRGMECHAWVNPFRYEVNAGSYGDVDIRAAHPDWLLYYSNGSYYGTILDPGQPVVRQYVTDVMMEMVNNYDLDGLIWDDYFYPYGGTTVEDSVSQRLYKPAGTNAGDWRRWNVNTTIEMIYDSIKAVKPWVRFGMAPFGIWTTKTSVATSYGISLPEGITGLDDYSVQFCDPIAWIQGGYVDYIAPQLYWPTYQTKQDYDVLSQWWGDVTKHFSDQLPQGRRVQFYSANNDYSDWVTVSEEAAQMRANRIAAPYEAPGAIFYNTNQYKAKGLINGLKGNVFSTKALPPAMDWFEHDSLPAPTNVSLSADGILTWESSAPRFAVYLYPKGVDPEFPASARYLYDIVWENSLNLTKIAEPFRTYHNNGTLSAIIAPLDRFANEFAPAFFNRADIEVRDSIDVHVTGIRMRLTETTLRIGGRIQLNPTIIPSNATVKTVIYKSDQPDVASVSEDGKVLAISDGVAVITATTLDGGYQVSCTITVIGGSGLDNTDAQTGDDPEGQRTMILENGTLYILRTVNGKEQRFTLTGQLIE